MKINNCQTCGQPMSKIPETLNLDCGGDCLSCMAWHGDPDAIEIVERLAGEKVNVLGCTYPSSNVEGQQKAEVRTEKYIRGISGSNVSE